MRSSVSVILSSPAPETSMSHPDYEQTAHDHGSLLILVKSIGAETKPKLFNRVFDKISFTNRFKLQDSLGNSREIVARYVKEYPVESNDWGDFQTHRRLLGVISVARCTSQTELNEACRIHESLKAKYVNTLYDSRCVIFGLNDELKLVDGTGAVGAQLTTPSNFKTRAHFYSDFDACQDFETVVNDFCSSLFWILESKREEKSREKIDKVALLLAPFEKKDIIGLDLESHPNRKKCVGRMTKHLGDLSLQCGLIQEALNFYQTATKTLRPVNDWLWLGASLEGHAAASSIVLYPQLNRTYESFQRNASLQDASGGKKKSPTSTTHSLPTPTASSSYKATQACLPGIEIPKSYREAILHYSKYQNAGIIETEACFKAARIAIEQGATLTAATVLQNVVFINLQLSEQEKILRFTTLADLYRQIGFMRKAAFFSRTAATRFVSLQNPTPNWSQCYYHMLQVFSGHKLSLDPTEFPPDGLMGWASLQLQLLQELIVAARRMDHPALATRHMTFLLQTLWPQLTVKDQRDFALQLQKLSAQCEGSPVPLVLDSGLVIPPANLTNIPMAKSFFVANMPNRLRPQKLQKIEDSGPFLFTPINFGSLDRRSNRDKVDYLWVEGDVCEVNIKLFNPLDFELLVSDVRLLTNGVVFESIPTSLAIPPETTCECILTGVPKEVGDLEILGYSTHALGVKSNCKLKHVPGLDFQNHTVEVIPALANISVSTSAAGRITAPVSSFRDPVHVAASSLHTLYAGESSQCNITITNTGAEPLEFIEVSLKSVLDPDIQAKTFQWSFDNISTQLPIAAGQSASFTVYIHAYADFLVPISEDESVMGGSDAPSLVGSGPTSLPSHMSSPTPSRMKGEVPSYRSGSTRSGGSIRLPASPIFRMPLPNSTKTVDGQLKIRYSGGTGLEAGYCRVCAVTMSLEILPSINITGWDVLPAETSFHFYLVLDVSNMTNQELELEYATNKSILLEANEPCRIPIPLPRCPLDKFPTRQKPGSLDAELEMERICSEHIASLVDLRWKLTTNDRNGRASLSGISLAPDMLHIVMVSPLQWDVTLNGEPTSPQDATALAVGEFFTLGVQMCNLSDQPLRSMALVMDCYQDFRNGTTNHAMDTRFSISGTDTVLFDVIEEQKSVYHEYRLIFFHTGHFKIGMTCTTQENLPASNSVVFNDLGNSWKLIPALNITIK